MYVISLAIFLKWESKITFSHKCLFTTQQYRIYRVHLLTFKGSSQSCGGLQDKQYDIGHLWSNETGTNLKLVQKVHKEIGVSRY